MSFAFPTFLRPFRYSPLSSTTEADQANTLQLLPHTRGLFQSKRIRLALATASIAAILLLLLHLYSLRQSGLDTSPHPGETPSSEPQACGNVDWSRFAYTQYATNHAYLCNSVMFFEALHRLRSKADRLLMYPSDFQVENTGLENESLESCLLRKARDDFGVKLQPIQVQQRVSNDPTWAESYTKLLAFNQTQYDRVLSLDSDSTVLQSMDELFLLPPVHVAMPRAYWLDFNDRILSSQVILLQPSEFEFDRIVKGIETAGSNDYDMEIVNTLYKDSALILPHRPYDLLTGEFRSKKHDKYLGNKEEMWDPDTTLEEAKFLHFSDWPVPKPWLEASIEIIENNKPSCPTVPGGNQTQKCREQDLWLGFYNDFARRRKKVCDIDVLKLKRNLEGGHHVTPPVYRPVFS